MLEEPEPTAEELTAVVNAAYDSEGEGGRTIIGTGENDAGVCFAGYGEPLLRLQRRQQRHLDRAAAWREAPVRCRATRIRQHLSTGQADRIVKPGSRRERHSSDLFRARLDHQPGTHPEADHPQANHCNR